MQNIEQKPISMMEALTGGFERLFKNPWALLVPVALDLFIWLGPQITIKPLFAKVLELINTTAILPPDASTDMTQSIELMRESLQTAGDTFNIFGVIASGVPTLFWIDPPTTDWARSTLFVIDHSLTLVAVLLPLAILGLLVTVLYFEMLGMAVRQEPSKQGLAARFLKVLFHTTILGLLLLGIMAVVILPLSLVATALSLVNQGLASFVLLTGMLVLLWAGLYLSFALPAIFVSDVNAPQAILNSVSLFRFDFWPTMGLIVIAYLIRWGFTIVWQLFINTPAGIVFDVIGNAFLGTGLMAATMLYYSDRMKWLNDLRRRIHQHQAQLKGQ